MIRVYFDNERVIKIIIEENFESEKIEGFSIVVDESIDACIEVFEGSIVKVIYDEEGNVLERIVLQGIGSQE